VACNAWNHPADCFCGWGGDAGGGRRSASLPVRSITIPDGQDWLRTRRPQLEAFVNPYARCPICGADVFFYNSPFGGRVFFDFLGPPWPKHPCTDTYLRRSATLPILPPLRPRILSAPLAAKSDGWVPLLPLRTAYVGDKERVRLDVSTTRLPSHYLYLPRGFAENRPCYWRRKADDPAVVEISSFSIDSQGRIIEDKIKVPGWIRNDAHLASLQGDEPDKEALSAIGWSLSFAWRTDDPRWYEAESVDIGLAKTYFMAAANKGYWAAWNNLGVLARDGLGAPTDPQLAFECFEKAAQDMEPISIRHLSSCYQNGIGVARDAAQAAFLEELAVSIEAEKTTPV
jgi:hypothetical protein